MKFLKKIIKIKLYLYKNFIFIFYMYSFRMSFNSLVIRNEGRDLSREGGDVIREACKWSPELAAACEVWKEIKFEFETIDKL